VAELIRNPDCGLVYCYPVLVDGRGTKISNIAPAHFPSGSVFKEFIQRNRITTFSATMVRRSAFFDVGGIDDSPDILTCDDYDLWLKLAAGHEVVFVSGDLVFYRIHPGNLLNNHHTNMNGHLQVMENCREFIRLNNQLLDANVDYEKVIAENEHRCYRRFGSIFYNDFPVSNLAARRTLKRALEISPLDMNSWLYYFMTFNPFVMLRKIKRSFAKKSQTIQLLELHKGQSCVGNPDSMVDGESEVKEAV